MGNPRYCSECGAGLSAAGKFCVQCGAPVLNATQSSDIGPTRLAEEVITQPRQNLLLRPVVLLPVGLLVGFGILWFMFSSVFNSPEAQLARCLDEGNLNLVAKRTADRISEMTAELDRASDSGEMIDFYQANYQLNRVYGPSFVSLGQDWARLDDCDSSVIGPLQEVTGQELTNLGDILTDVEVGDYSELNRAINHMENVKKTTKMLSLYLESN